MKDKQKYMHWLEEMWEVQKFDLSGRTQREEERKEDILEILKGLSEISKHRVQAPYSHRWEPS